MYGSARGTFCSRSFDHMPLLNGNHTLQVNLVVVPFVFVECLPLPVRHVVGLELETVTHVRALFWGAVADAGTWFAPWWLFDALEHVCEGCHGLRVVLDSVK